MNHAVRAGRRQRLAIRAEGERIYGGAVEQGQPDFTRLWIPDLRRAIVAGGGQQSAVRAEGDGAGAAGVTAPGAHLRARSNIPQRDNAVGRSGGQESAV